MYKVYVKTNDAGEIIAINSDAFLDIQDGWENIDEGSGDRFHHAQGNYLPAPVTDEHGRYNFKLVDGVVTAIPDEEKPALPQPEAPAPLEEQVAELREALNLLLEGATE